jgi:hypothetical protein
MPKLREIVAQPAFQPSLFVFFLVLLSWPLISIAGDRDSLASPLYIFTIWVLMITVLALNAYCISSASEPNQGDKDQGE